MQKFSIVKKNDICQKAWKRCKNSYFIFLHTCIWWVKCKKIKSCFCSAFMPFGACKFLHYAKFLHLDALQHFSLLNLNWNIGYFIFLHQCIWRVKCKKIKSCFAALSCLLDHVNFLHYAKFIHFSAFQHFSLLNFNWKYQLFYFFLWRIKCKKIFYFLQKCIWRVKCKK